MPTQRQSSPLRGLLLFLLGGLVGANATYFLMTRHAGNGSSATSSEGIQVPLPVAGSSVPAIIANKVAMQHADAPVLPAPVASMRGTPMPAASAPVTAGSDLLIPVQGIAASELTDTFTDSRSSGRVHDAIDIMAAAGTPVLATADGHVEKLFNSKLGGLTLYEFNTDGTLAYYYAHLQRYADGLAEQQAVKRGQLLGYVGSTGNASPEAPHLHFAIFVLGPEKQWWKGDPVNPYPRLGGAPH